MESLNKSLISREASTGIKGLLIFLIILGHNNLFSTESRIGMVYLYTFHIQAFFMLPFLYPHKELSFNRIRNYIARLYYPYIFLFIILSILNLFITKYGIIQQPPLYPLSYIHNYTLEFFLTLINGNGYNIDFFTGLQFLWFLPVMFSMNILKDYYYSCHSKYIQISLIILGLIFFFVYFIFGFRAPFDKRVIFYIKEYSPFAFTYALGALFMGIVGRNIIKIKSRYSNVMTILLFISGTYICFSSQHDGEVPINDEIRWGLLLMMPFIFFYLLYYNRKYIEKSKILQEIGKYSFPIFIIHPFLLKISSYLISKFFDTNWLNVLIIQLLVTILSYYIARFIYSIQSLKTIIFPNTWQELTQWYKSKKI